MKPNTRIRLNDTRPIRADKSLLYQINRIRREQQAKYDKKYGKGKVRVTNVFASKLAAGRLKK